MAINTNAWNKFRYSIYTPVYNVIDGIFRSSRMESINRLNIERGANVLLVGAGTGLDIPYLPKDIKVVATDITPSMIVKIKKSNQQWKYDLTALVMDGQNLSFKDNSFDYIILHLILAVIPDPKMCIKEVERVLRPGGKVAIFDKFVPAHSQPSILRKGVNVLTTTLFSDITRDIYQINSTTQLKIIQDTEANVNGMFRLITLESHV